MCCHLAFSLTDDKLFVEAKKEIFLLTHPHGCFKKKREIEKED
jgi:hypothetical protein